jgi:uncharacterized protein (DUF1499 family)
MVILATAAPEPLLPLCPASPNCVSSLAADSHFIPPLIFTGSPEAAVARLKDLVAKRDDATIIAADSTTIRVEFRTLLGFVDDGLFVLDGSQSLIQWRSAARSGYWDLGKNRRRLEEIRQSFEQASGR